MQIENSMPLGEIVIASAVSAGFGWLTASLTKVSKSDFKEVVKRLEATEKDLTGRMTRAEFEQAFNKVDLLVREFRAEARAEFKDLKAELKGRV